MWVLQTKNVDVLYLCSLAIKNLRDLRVPPRSSQELRSSASGKPATTRCVITRKSTVLHYFAVAPSNQSNQRRHKYHTPSSLSSDFVTGTKIAITWYYSNYSHISRSSSCPVFTAPQYPTRAKR